MFIVDQISVNYFICTTSFIQIFTQILFDILKLLVLHMNYYEKLFFYRAIKKKSEKSEKK